MAHNSGKFYYQIHNIKYAQGRGDNPTNFISFNVLTYYKILNLTIQGSRPSLNND